MNRLNLNDVNKYVEENIGDFHLKRIENIKKLKLTEILKRKNPYLYKAKNLMTAEEIIKGFVDATVSSSEEGVFGNFLEGLAIFVCQKAYNGRKSSSTGIDFEFDINNTRNIIALKSGPNWGNSDQKRNLINNFNAARKTIKTSGSGINIKAVNGCCYGRNSVKSEYHADGDYYVYCGQKFWSYISGNDNLYLELIEPLGHKAKEKNEEYLTSYSQVINNLNKELLNNFYHNGKISWAEIVRYNSSADKPKRIIE